MLKSSKLEKSLEPRIDEPEVLIKEVKAQHTGRQMIIQIPSLVVEALGIKKGDIFIFKIPLFKKKDYSIKLKKEIK